MFWDEEYIEENLEELINQIENQTFNEEKCTNFISYDSLEDEFSHNEIEEAQRLFMKKSKEYLSKHYPGKYAMWCDWCVHVCTVELYRDIMWNNTKHKESYINLRESRDIIQ